MKNLILLIGLLSFLSGQNSKNQLLPSEAIATIYYLINSHPDKNRMDVIGHIMPKVITEGLDRDEQFHLGDVYFWNFKGKESYEIFSQLIDGNDIISRSAWNRYLTIKWRAFNQYAAVEADFNTYRKKFKPVQDDLSGLYGRIYDICSYYAKSDNHKKIYQLIMDEIAYLDYQAPYKSFKLPILFKQTFNVLDKSDEYAKYLEMTISGLKKTYQNRTAHTLEKDVEYAVYTPLIEGMMTAVDKKLSNSQLNKEFEKMINLLEKERDMKTIN